VGNLRQAAGARCPLPAHPPPLPAHLPLRTGRPLQSISTATQVTYPHYQYLLSDCIARFTGEDTLYEKEKLWYLVFQLCSAATVFHAAGEKVGDVRPRKVFLNDFERVKVGTHLSWPQETTNYAKALLDKEVTYLGRKNHIQHLKKSRNSASATTNPRPTSNGQRASQSDSPCWTGQC
jgi:hypothetical protein